MSENRAEHFVHREYGYCYWAPTRGGFLIGSLYVEPPYRGRGYARALLEYVTREIRRSDPLAHIFIEALPVEPGIDAARLKKFYRAYGLIVR